MDLRATIRGIRVLANHTWYMALWDERIGSHEAWAEVERARARFAELTVESPGHEALVRPTHLLEVLAARLRALDPYMATDALLNGIQSKASALNTQVSQHFAPPEGQPATPVEKINSTADGLAQHMATMPAAGSEELVAITGEFRAELDGLREQVHSIVEEANASVAASTEEHTATLEQRKGEAAQLATSLTEANSAIEELQAKVDQFIAERTAETTAAAEAAKARADEQHSSAKEQLDGMVLAAAKKSEEEEQRLREAHTELIEEQRAAGGEHLSEIEKLKVKVENLVGAVGRSGLTAGFQQWEKVEQKQANQMRLVAIVFGALAAVAVLGMLVLKETVVEGTGGTDWTLTVGGIAVPAAFGAVFAYAGRESSKHRRNQVIARRMELDLASFPAFLSDLEPDRQAELTAFFAPVFFGQAPSHSELDRRTGDDAPQPLTKDVLSKVAERTKEWFEKSPDDGQ